MLPSLPDDEIMYLAQTENNNLQNKALEISIRLKLKYEYRLVGYGHLEESLSLLKNRK